VFTTTQCSTSTVHQYCQYKVRVHSTYKRTGLESTNDTYYTYETNFNWEETVDIGECEFG